MRGAKEFLDTVVARERAIAALLFSPAATTEAAAAAWPFPRVPAA